MKQKKLDEKWKVYAAAGSVCVVLYVVLMNIGKVMAGIGVFLSAFSTVFIGAVTAIILNPIAVFFFRSLFKKMKNRKTAWTVSVVFTVILLILFIASFLMLLVPQLAENLKSFITNLDMYADNLKEYAEYIEEPYGSKIKSFIEEFAGDNGVLDTVGSMLLKDMNSVVSKTASFGGKAVGYIIGFIMALYFLIAKDSIRKVFSRLFSLLLSQNTSLRDGQLINKFNSIFSTYIVFQLLDSLIIGTLNYIFMVLTKMPDALLISVVNAITNLIPTFGPIIGGAVGALLLLLTKPVAIIPYLLFTILLQMSDGYLIKPRLFGSALNVPGLIILIFVIVLGKLGGVAGMFLAIPFAAIFVYAYEDLFIPWLELKRDLKDYKKEMERTARAGDGKLQETDNTNS